MRLNAFMATTVILGLVVAAIIKLHLMQLDPFSPEAGSKTRNAETFVVGVLLKHILHIRVGLI